MQGYSSQKRIPHRGEPGAIPGNLHKVEDSLGWQNRLIDKASVQSRLTTKRMYHNGMSFFSATKEDDRLAERKSSLNQPGYKNSDPSKSTS